MKKSIISFFSLLTGCLAGGFGVGKVMGRRAEQNQKMSDKHMSLFLMMNQWVKIKQEGKYLKDYFEQKGYNEIAIYGMSLVGRTLVQELKGSNIKIKYGIDRKSEDISCEFAVITPEDELENVDAVVVTPITFFIEIEECIGRKIDCPIVSLEDILYEI